MKKIKSILALGVTAGLLLQSQGCYGNFALTKKLYNWNGTVGDKYINSIIMFALGAVQVYTICAFADWAVFNTLEFWTGKNPVTLKNGETETQIVFWQGERYEITATTNRFDIRPLNVNSKQKSAVLEYDNQSKTWFSKSVDDKNFLRILDISKTENISLVKIN